MSNIWSYSHELDESREPLTGFESHLTEQNENLNALEDGVERLGRLSLTISKEIDFQNKMLSALEIDAEKASDEANTLNKKTEQLIKRAGGPKMFCTIISLLVVLFFLTFLVIYN